MNHHYREMAAFRSVIGLASRAACSECCRHLSLTSLLDASRHLKQSTAFRLGVCVQLAAVLDGNMF